MWDHGRGGLPLQNDVHPTDGGNSHPQHQTQGSPYFRYSSLTHSLHIWCNVYFWISRNWFGRISKICIFKHRMIQEVCLPFIYMCLGKIIIHGICMQPLLREKMTLFFFHWIIGSPFVYSVGQLSSGGTHKVQVGGPGVEKGEVGFSSKWNLLNVSVEVTLIMHFLKLNVYLSKTTNVNNKKNYEIFWKFLKIVFVYSQLIVNSSFKICKQTLTLELY